jgi:hypothetical protein
LAAASTAVGNAGLPMSNANRATASNAFVLAKPMYARGRTIEAGGIYVDQMAKEALGSSAPEMIRNAWVGGFAPNMSSQTVDALAALGPEGAGDTARVAAVASLIDPGRRVDGPTAVRMLNGIMNSGAGSMGVSRMTQSVAMAGPSFGSPANFGAGFGPPPTSGFFDRPAGGGMMMDTIIDTQFAGMPGGGGGVTNLGTMGSAMYAGANPVLGNTIVRGVAAGAMMRHTLHANMDIQSNTAAMNNFAPPPSLGAQLQPRMETDVVIDPQVRMPSSGPQNINLSVPSTATQQELHITRSASAGPQTQYSTLNVNAQLIEPSGNMAPHIGEIPQVANVNERVATSISYSGGGNTYTDHGTSHIFVDPSTSSGTIAQLQHDLGSIAASASHDYGKTYASAQHVAVEFLSAGLTPDKISNPQIANVGMQVYKQDPSMTSAFVIAANNLKPDELSLPRVQTVEYMRNAGYSDNRISRQEIFTAERVIAGGGYPSPTLIQMIHEDTSYAPEETYISRSSGMSTQVPTKYFDRNYVENLRRGRGRPRNYDSSPARGGQRGSSNDPPDNSGQTGWLDEE